MSVRLRNVQARAELEQHLDRGDRLVLECAYERDAAETVLRVGVRAVLEQDSCDVCARVGHAGVVQRGVTDNIRGIRRRAAFEEVLQRPDVVC